MWYLISLFILVILYVLSIIKMKHSKDKTLKILSCLPLVVFTIQLFVIVYWLVKVGPNDWNFKNVLPIANVSPFMFTIVILVMFLPTKSRKYFNTLISLLSFAMLIASSINLLFNSLRNYNFYFIFLLDSINHVLFSLYGIYLYKTNQIFKDLKNNLISGSLIVVVAICMLIINVIFDTSFFGLSLLGKHNIYNVVISENSIVSVLVYFVGLIIALFTGFVYQRIISKYLK